MLTTTVCVTVTCDRCGEKYRDEEWETTVHFASESQALKWLAEREWHVTDDGRALSCDRCVAERLCAEQGHVIEYWHDCRCRPDLGHRSDAEGRCTRQFAWCDRCQDTVRRNRPAGQTTPVDKAVA